MVHATEDRDEKAFLAVALKTAWIDLRAGRETEFDYVTFIEVMRAMYKKRVLLKDVLDGQADKHRWWPEDEQETLSQGCRVLSRRSGGPGPDPGLRSAG